MTHESASNDIAREVPVPGPWRYFAIHPENGALRGGWVAREHYAALLDELAPFNIYVHLNPSVGRRVRPTSLEVIGWQAVLIDLDPREGRGPIVTEPEVARSIRGYVQDALADLLKVPTLPWTVDTGRGVHLWVTFPLVSPAPPWAPAAMRGFLRALAQHPAMGGYGACVDFSNTDLPRLARAPGSINHRTGRRAETITLGEPITDHTILSQFAPEKTFATRNSSLEASKWGDYLAVVTQGAALFLTEGATLGSRHDALCKTAYSLRENGCPEYEILSALEWGNWLCGADALPAWEVARIVETTRRKQCLT